MGFRELFVEKKKFYRRKEGRNEEISAVVVTH
jgi:hypothetical protein